MPSAPHIAEPIGESPSFRWVLEMARRAARYMVFVVLLHGEVGVGKEEVARYIHAMRGVDAPFLTVQVGARPVDALRIELLGVGGVAITGGEGRAGQLELVGDGTVFLPDVEQLAPTLQADLADLLERREFRRVGEVECRVPHFILIASTTRGLRELAATGSFRPDLCCCLEACRIPIPLLRDRREDIPFLTEALLSRIVVPAGIAMPAIESGALRWLQEQDWPENVLGLKSFLERAVLLADDGVISVDVAEQARRLVGGRLPAARLTEAEGERPTHPLALSILDNEALIEGVHVISAARARTKWLVLRYFVEQWLAESSSSQDHHRFHRVAEVRRALKEKGGLSISEDAVQKNITRLRESFDECCPPGHEPGRVIETSPDRKGYRLRPAGLAVEIAFAADVARGSR